MSRTCRVCNYCYVFDGNDTCDRCKQEHSLANEPKRTCPVDGVEMKKLRKENVVLDHCEKCDGIWVDGYERELLKASLKSELTNAHYQSLVTFTHLS